ncbi:MAG: ATP-binding protein [Nocardiopsaceae bacterium]|nr:ATP-binding protein [Nocardiopsaceae bacterium]
MDEAGELDKVVVDHGWRYTWLGNDPYVFDERTEYLARISPIVLGGLGTATSAGPLGEVLRNLAETASDGGEAATAEAAGDGVTVRLRLLGVRVNVRCAYQECADEIAAFYSASHVPEQASSPEVIVWCETRGAGRYLFRSRPDDHAGTPLDGVSVQTLRSPVQPWTSSLPPIPPLGSWPFKDRFAALHAAAVRLASGECILIAGDRGSGKTTAALALAERLKANVLCDETAFVHCRTNVVESFPHAVGVWRDGRKVRVPITDVCSRIGTEPASISRLVFLRRSAGGRARVSRLTKPQTLRFLLDQHRDSGASIGDAMQTMLNLAERCDASVVDYSVTTDFIDALCELAGDPRPNT